MMDAPPSPVFQKIISSSWTQFKMSWYIFFYQMPRLPEFAVRMFDLKVLNVIKSKTGGTTDEDLEAFKYTFTKKGALTYPINYYRANFNFTKRKVQKPGTFAPGLYLIGEHDLYISKDTGPLAKKYYENLDYQVVSGANHFAQQDAPETVNTMIRTFLNKH
jgi:epoxide hydrolase 4